jgi:hypothetical protein
LKYLKCRDAFDRVPVKKYPGSINADYDENLLLLEISRVWVAIMTWGKLSRNIRSRVYPAVTLSSAAFLLLVGAGLLLGWLQIEISPNKPESVPIANDDPLPIQLPEDPAEPATPRAVSSPLASASPTSTDATLSADRDDRVAGSVRQGALRVSNQTQHPVRVALLPKQAQPNSSTAAKSSKPSYGAPAHWDFAPTEGAKRGLLLSLPNMDLKLQPGDVLVAFSEDGSRLYWGPYVVGETLAPVWDSKTSEWQLTLQ